MISAAGHANCMSCEPRRTVRTIGRPRKNSRIAEIVVAAVSLATYALYLRDIHCKRFGFS